MYKEENTLANRIAQFEQDQKRTVPASPSKKSTPTAPTSGNPYLRARLQILEGWMKGTDKHGRSLAWKAEEIKDMEKTGNIDNPHYAAFVHEVAILGDQLS